MTETADRCPVCAELGHTACVEQVTAERDAALLAQRDAARDRDQRVEDLCNDAEHPTDCGVDVTGVCDCVIGEILAVLGSADLRAEVPPPAPAAPKFECRDKTGVLAVSVEGGETNMAYIYLANVEQGSAVRQREVKAILDYDAEGEVIGVEVFDWYERAGVVAQARDIPPCSCSSGWEGMNCPINCGPPDLQREVAAPDVQPATPTTHEFVLRHGDPFFPRACGRRSDGGGSLCGESFEHPVHQPSVGVVSTEPRPADPGVGLCKHGVPAVMCYFCGIEAPEGCPEHWHPDGYFINHTAAEAVTAGLLGTIATAAERTWENLRSKGLYSESMREFSKALRAALADIPEETR